MRNSILLTIGSIFLLFGCANLDVAQKAYQKGDYNTSVSIYNQWAKRGFPKAQLKLATMANEGIIKASPKYIISNALSAYKKGYKKAANIIFYNYYKIGNFKKASYWLKKVIFDTMDLKTCDVYLVFLQKHIDNLKFQRQYLKSIESYAIKSKNPKVLYALGKFYEDSTFVNFQKSKRYYKLSFQKGFIPAGIKLGLLYIYKLNKPRKGIKLLQKLSNQDNGTSAYNIALYLLSQMKQELQKLNTPCISFYFKTPKEFFTKKIKAKLFQNIFLKKNVAPWLLYAYKRGYIAGKLKLISLDAKAKNFNKKDNLSGMGLKEAISFLEQLDIFKAKMILAQIYESYPNLHQLSKAKIIYEEYENINKLDAYWHLYQFYKRFYQNGRAKDYYLNYLVSHNFEPAKIEKAYFDILNKKDIENNMNILQFYSEQKNILALTYLSSIYAIDNKLNDNRLTLHKLCKVSSPLNSSLDMKIAKLYLKENKLIKSATIYQYYAKEFPNAAYSLSKIYNTLNECKKYLYWLEAAKNNGLKQAELEYAKLILKGKIDGNLSKAVSIIKQYATNNDPISLVFLGNLYKNGIAVKFDPEKAKKYYQKAIELGYSKAYINLAGLYKTLNVSGKYNNKILKIYNTLIRITNDDNIKLEVAQFLFNNNKYKKALKYIEQNRLYRYDKGKYLYYKLTGKKINLGKTTITSDPRLILLNAKLLQNKDRKKALYYAFISAFYNTNGSSEFIVRQLKFFSAKTVRKIYKKAKEDFKKMATTNHKFGIKG